MAGPLNSTPNGAAAQNRDSPSDPLAIARTPTNAAAIPDLIEQIASSDFNTVIEHYEARLRLLSKARNLVQALETPRETMVREALCWVRRSVSSPILNYLKPLTLS